ncbi:MAG: anaerobic glycerol-3-phosphate dehydrogenase subunit A, partial [Hyphomicrobiales bacterium]|nr:anaerobic glycerol-3-phosphate dehydrogenase subunit A [Hyphomicrobiales bacterium]
MATASDQSDTGKVHETEVLIIGAGVTGCGVMRDLALRGISSILVDKGDLNAGASGANHGLLHSGGRYAVTDPEAARECRQEGEILKRVAPHCIEDCGGLFVAVEGDDADFAERFAAGCETAGIACERMTGPEAHRLEPALSDRIIAAFAVPDSTIDPFRLTMAHVNDARRLAGSRFLPHTAVTGFQIAHGEITAAHCRDRQSGEAFTIRARQVVNAAGAWAMQVVRFAGCTDISLVYGKGTLAITNTRLALRVLNRLRPPGDGDILVPGGTVSLLGTTSDLIDDPDQCRPTAGEVDRNLCEGVQMVPALAHTRFIRAFSGVRPLLAGADTGAGGRKASRSFALFDHTKAGLSNLVTITGGKLTTFRLMAEKTSDLIARRLGNREPCRTAEEPLAVGEALHWTEARASAKAWFAAGDAADAILCECEMVPKSVVDAILNDAPGAERQMPLKAIGLRSRIGKGSCQGAFCSVRVTSHLYDRDAYTGIDGLRSMRDFLAERYKGIRPVLWGAQLAQTELAETLHCGLMGLDLIGAARSDGDDNGAE